MRTVYCAFLTAKKDNREVIHGTSPREFMTEREIDIVKLTREYEERGWKIENVERRVEGVQ